MQARAWISRLRGDGASVATVAAESSEAPETVRAVVADYIADQLRDPDLLPRALELAGSDAPASRPLPSASTTLPD